MYQFARDAAVAEAWLIAQEPYLMSTELGHTIDEVENLIKKHEAFEKSAAAQEERFSALERLTTVRCLLSFGCYFGTRTNRSMPLDSVMQDFKTTKIEHFNNVRMTLATAVRAQGTEAPPGGRRGGGSTAPAGRGRRQGGRRGGCGGRSPGGGGQPRCGRCARIAALVARPRSR